jgi:hypothetical protein
MPPPEPRQRPWRRALLLVLPLSVIASGPLAAQDEELQPLALLLERAGGATELEARSLQIYRIPLAYTVRDLETQLWGFRLTFPVSLGAHELDASNGVVDLLERVESMTVTPGVELQIGLGPGWRLKPFGELGVTTASAAGDTELTYGIGVRARGERELGASRLLLGGAARYASPRTHRAQLQDYTALEVGGDVQVPLGFSVASRPASGGVYGVVRFFPDLEGPAEALLDVGRLYEVGLSFSTDPAPKLWLVELPWIALGYRWGGPLSGLRLSFSFPF